MKKTAKGKRPLYLDGSQTDKLLAIVMELASEVSVLRERLDTIERLAEAKGWLSRLEIDAYIPDEQASQERERWRSEYLSRIFRVLDAEKLE